MYRVLCTSQKYTFYLGSSTLKNPKMLFCVDSIKYFRPKLEHDVTLTSFLSNLSEPFDPVLVMLRKMLQSPRKFGDDICNTLGDMPRKRTGRRLPLPLPHGALVIELKSTH